MSAAAESVLVEVCPICFDPLGEVAETGYRLENRNVATCATCRQYIGHIMLEQTFGLRRNVLGRSKNIWKIQARLHEAVREARGLPAGGTR